MAKEKQPRGSRYTPEQDALIRKLSNKSWAAYEISYRLFQLTGEARTTLAVNQRRMHLIANGTLEKRESSKRCVTSEALNWYNKTFKTKFGPAPMLELVEEKPRTVHSAKQRKTEKINGNGFNILSAREVIGFTKLKGADEPNPTYTVILLRLQRKSPDTLNLFQHMLETGVEDGKTAEDMIEELRLASL